MLGAEFRDRCARQKNEDNSQVILAAENPIDNRLLIFSSFSSQRIPVAAANAAE
ncbi:MAG: hypothetical protein HKL90_14830 [Elusimicrobia bacterium]|nr:hypothetical protein [Elusimicrobiota bacterium]